MMEENETNHLTQIQLNTHDYDYKISIKLTYSY